MTIAQINERDFDGTDQSVGHSALIAKIKELVDEVNTLSSAPGTGKIAGSTTVLGPFTDTAEHVLFTLVIPGGTLSDADLLRLHFLSKVVAFPGGGTFKDRLYINGSLAVEASQFASTGSIQGFDFAQAGVIFTGGAATTTRLVDAFNGIDVTVDSTADITVEHRAILSTAGGNSFEGLYGHVGF